MIYPFLNKKTKMFYRNFSKDHNPILVFLLFLFIKYDVRIEHYKISKCEIYYKFRLLTSILLRLLLILLFPFSMLFNFKGTINSFWELFVSVGEFNYLKSYILSVKESALIIK